MSQIIGLLFAKEALRAVGVLLIVLGVAFIGLGLASYISVTSPGSAAAGGAGSGAVSALVEWQQNLFGGVSNTEWVLLGCALSHSLATGDWSVFCAAAFQALEGTLNPALQALKLQIGGVLTAQTLAKSLNLSGQAQNYLALMAVQSLPVADLIMRNIGAGLINAGVLEGKIEAAAAGAVMFSAASATPAGIIASIGSSIAKHAASIWDPWSRLGLMLGDP